MSLVANQNQSSRAVADSRELPADEFDLSFSNFQEVTNSDRVTLQKAFATFNQMSAKLTESYDLLQHRVEVLTSELASVSAQRMVELAEKEKLADRLKSLLHMLPAGVLLLDETGQVVDANSAATDLLLSPLQQSIKNSLGQDHSYPTVPTNLIGQPWRRLIQVCFQPRHDDGHEISLVNGKRVNLKTTAMMNERGQLILLTDMTETRQLQAQLSQHERLSAMGKMVASLAHQIRTPLSAATLYADHLINPQLKTEQRTNFAGKLKERLIHLESQIRDMLIFARGDTPLTDTVSLEQLLQGVQAAAEVPLQQFQAVCEWSSVSANISFRCHYDALISCLINLINNALEAGPAESHAQSQLLFKLTVETDKPNGLVTNDPVQGGAETPVPQQYLKISVADNGPGLSQQESESAIAPFYTTKANGTGLGLAVVQAVAKAHQGTFSLSGLPAGGAIAQLRLPVFNSSEKRTSSYYEDKSVAPYNVSSTEN